MALICIVLSFWYFVLFALWYTGDVIINTTCDQHEAFINAVSPYNNTMDLITCSNGTTIFSFLGVDSVFQNFNLTSQVSPYVSLLNETYANVSKPNTLNNMQTNISSLSDVTDIDFAAGYSIPNVIVSIAFFNTI